MYLCPLFSGSSGNSTLVEIGGARILVDAGKTCRSLEDSLRNASIPPDTITALLITHEHIDHIRGAGVFSRRYNIPIYANSGTWEGMAPVIGEVAPANVRVFATDHGFFLKDAAVLPIKTPHDARESVGYRFQCGGHSMVVMTDIGYADPILLDQAAGSDIVLIEANHDPDLVRSCRYSYPTKLRILSDHGHLSNENAGRALARLYTTGVKRAILGHLSKDNNFAQLALSTVREQLRLADIPDEAFDLAVALRDEVTGMFLVSE